MITDLIEAISHAKEKARELNNTADNWKWLSDEKGLSLPSDYEPCKECAKEHLQLASWLEELQERREADRWRPVSEPPKKEGKCFVFTDYGDVTMDSYIDGMFVCNLGNVTHWKPLPKAPESEEE